MKSTFHGETPITLWPANIDEITLVGSRCGPFPEAIALLATGQVEKCATPRRHPRAGRL